MKRYSAAVAAIVLITLTMATAAMAADDPFNGTWKLNIGKSNFTGTTPYKAQIVKIESQENGSKIVDDHTTLEGKQQRTLYDCKYDGKDYPLKGDAETGSTYAMKKIDSKTIDGIWKSNGKVIETGRWVISQDGKTMTGKLQQKNANGKDTPITAVFDKQ